MSETRLSIRDCDLFVGLRFRKTGEPTEEYSTSRTPCSATGAARASTRSSRTPASRSVHRQRGVSLLALKKELASLRHFHTGNNDAETHQESVPRSLVPSERWAISRRSAGHQGREQRHR
jgi:hypothetical protein